jgi:hypothetical protein
LGDVSSNGSFSAPDRATCLYSRLIKCVFDMIRLGDVYRILNILHETQTGIK